ncbi:40S ribosomal protein S27-like [Choloepus didactylus]|uniref:40S ribosomal protein S27-like n=1 Tax=Choloepus didactylus TaxID=27675 RepID=UPI0018A0051E|nr:40S ribosomal protein S27-like [Choloepus didactylus]
MGKEHGPLTKDLLHPSPGEEKRKHKKQHPMQSPNSYFMDMKCSGCYKVAAVFSHAQTPLCQLTGEKAGLTRFAEGCSFKQLQHRKHLKQDEWDIIPSKHVLD